MRLPIDAEGLHVIPLYDEVPVVVAAADSHLMAADELDLADLAGEIVVVPRDDVLAAGGARRDRAILRPAGRHRRWPSRPSPPGVGVVIVPMSLARLHHRKDADYRPLRDGPVSTVALAWPADRTTPAVEAFVGIVRGRTAELLALTAPSHGRDRRMSPTWVPATSPADPAQEAACPDHAPGPLPPVPAIPRYRAAASRSDTAGAAVAAP